MRRLAAAAAVAFGVGAATLLPDAPAASAATPRHVAIVIAGHGTYCVRAGGSGDTVLNDVVEVGYRPSDHIIWQIDNYPSPPYTDSTHYWSYWHDTRGSWSYSTSGASGYTPPAGSVEGWIFGNGSAPPPRNPSGLYAALCGYLDAPPPPPPSSTAPVVRRTTAAPGPTADVTVRTTAPHHVASPSTQARPSRSTSTAPRRSRARVTVMPRSSSPAVGATTSSVVPVSSTPAPASTSTRAAPKHASGSAVPAVAGAGLAAIIAAGGGWAAWRRRRG